MRLVVGWALAVVLALAGWVPVSATAAPSAPSLVCPAATWGALALPTGRISAVSAVPAVFGFDPVAPAGGGAWYGVRPSPTRSGGWPQPAALVLGSLAPHATVRGLAHVQYWPFGVAVSGGLIVNEDKGALSAYDQAGHLVWRTRLGDGAGLSTDTVAVRAIGSDVVALVTPDAQPSTGHVIGVDAATGRVNVRAPVPQLNYTGYIACAAGTLYVISDMEPAPGKGRMTSHGYIGATQAVVAAVSARTGRLEWHRVFVTVPPGPNCSGQYWSPYATAAGLLWARAPAICSNKAGTFSGQVHMQLFAPGTGRVVWQVTYPQSLGAPVSNGTLVAEPLPNGREEIRDFATGRLVRTFRLPKDAHVVFATTRSIAAASCLVGRGCHPHMLLWSFTGVRLGTLPRIGNSPPFAETQGSLYGYSTSGRSLLVYRLQP